jgi:hypothetical protein
VPVLELRIAPVPAKGDPLVETPPVTFPTIVAVAGETPEKDKQPTNWLSDLLVTFAVSVTPEFKTNVPEPAFEISVQDALAVMVIV